MNAEHAGEHGGRVPLVVGLVGTGTLGASELGAKAANLGRLAREGFPVPPGLVVTPAAGKRWEETSPRLLEAAANLEAKRFAVRSSGTAEDLEGASFAGQYETILSVPLEGLPEAVRRVFDSAGASRVSAYREARGEASAGSGGPRMAVLVQAMVDADSSGVAFTAGPVTGRRDEVVITAVRGLGERLVSGEAVGDEWVVRGEDAALRRESEGDLDASQALEVAALARRVLPSANLVDTLQKGSFLTVVGYGANDFDTGGGSQQPIYPNSRQMATTEYLGTKGIANQVGEDVFIKTKGSGMGQGGEGTCYGDSGGPLFLDDQTTVVAVTSFGPTSAIPCSGPDYAQRVDLPVVLNWVNSFL